MERLRELDTRQAARRLGVCVETVRRMIRSGLLPAKRRGGYRYVIHEADVEKVFEAALADDAGALPPLSR